VDRSYIPDRSKGARLRIWRLLWSGGTSDWLKEIENRELREAARGGTAPSDMSWIWQELRVDRER
jgi:hypothetical protein